MLIHLHYSNKPAFSFSEHLRLGLGGTENFAAYMARDLARKGHEVHFYNHIEADDLEEEGVHWHNLEHFDPEQERDILISFRMREVFKNLPNTKLKVLILADTESVGLGNDVREGNIDIVMPVGKWQLDKIASEEALVDHACWMPASNGVDMSEFPLDAHQRISGKCIHLSTPERGLTLLLELWPEIERAEELVDKGIKPELHLFSSFMGWGTGWSANEEMSRGVYELIEQMKHDGYNIINHKHVPRDEMREHQLTADLMLYPTEFFETYCITLSEVQAAGCIPVVSNRGALGERVVDATNGYLVGTPEQNATSPEMRKAFVQKAVTALYMDEDKKAPIRAAARETAAKHDYGALTAKWLEAWQARMTS